MSIKLYPIVLALLCLSMVRADPLPSTSADEMETSFPTITPAEENDIIRSTVILMDENGVAFPIDIATLNELGLDLSSLPEIRDEDIAAGAHGFEVAEGAKMLRAQWHKQLKLPMRTYSKLRKYKVTAPVLNQIMVLAPKITPAIVNMPVAYPQGVQAAQLQQQLQQQQEQEETAKQFGMGMKFNKIETSPSSLGSLLGLQTGISASSLLPYVSKKSLAKILLTNPVLARKVLASPLSEAQLFNFQLHNTNSMFKTEPREFAFSQPITGMEQESNVDWNMIAKMHKMTRPIRKALRYAGISWEGLSPVQKKALVKQFFLKNVSPFTSQIRMQSPISSALANNQLLYISDTPLNFDSRKTSINLQSTIPTEVAKIKAIKELMEAKANWQQQVREQREQSPVYSPSLSSANMISAPIKIGSNSFGISADFDEYTPTDFDQTDIETLEW